MKTIAEAARGRWPEILSHFKVALPPHGKHGACPSCGGKDRFRFDDKEHRGTFYCSNCGAGDGFHLLKNVKGFSFPQVVNEVREYLGIERLEQRAAKDDPAKAMRSLWERGRRPAEDGPVARYISSRGLCWRGYESIRECLSVYDPETRKNYPAMLAKIVADNKAVNLHITYLTEDGRKADIPKQKRVMAGRLPEGSAIRLGAVEPIMGIAEGIETALAAAEMHMMPVWACVSGNGLAKWVPPAGAKEIVVFGDNDANYAGQAKAYAAAHRLATIFKRKVAVRIPHKAGTDWNDELTAF